MNDMAQVFGPVVGNIFAHLLAKRHDTQWDRERGREGERQFYKYRRIMAKKPTASHH